MRSGAGVVLVRWWEELAISITPESNGDNPNLYVALICHLWFVSNINISLKYG